MHIVIVTVFRFTVMFINIVFKNIIVKVMKIVCVCWLKLWILNYDACNGKYKKQCKLLHEPLGDNQIISIQINR